MILNKPSVKYLIDSRKVVVLLFVSLLVPVYSFAAEDEDNAELNVIELELERSVPQKQKQNETSTTKQENISPTFSELGQIAPFSEVSIIAKRYMPKTERFQFFGGLSLTTNDPFYFTNGFTLRGSYFLTEKWGVELTYLSLSSSQAKATQELLDIQSINTDSLAFTKQYMGASVIYTPIYGKMTWFNDQIVPFDLYFGLGTGSTKTHVKDGISTMSFSTGQIFSMTKSFALRWDFTWNFFSAKAINEEGTINNLLLSFGASYFLPEAKYR